jgi:hypothetical protein
MAEKIKADKLGSILDIGTQGVGLGLGITQTLVAIKDAKKRAEFEQNLALLTQTQKNELESEIQRATALNDRIRIITEAITKIRVAEVQKKLGKKPEDNKKQLYFIIGGGVAVLLVAIVIKLMSKK